MATKGVAGIRPLHNFPHPQNGTPGRGQEKTWKKKKIKRERKVTLGKCHRYLSL